MQRNAEPLPRMPTPDHLQLARIQRPPQPRRKVQRAMPRNPHHDHTGHASKLRQDAQQSIAALRARQNQPLDFDPKLMLRFTLNRRIADNQWRPSGLTLLDSSDRFAAVVFAERDDLDLFLRRVGEYAKGPRERSGSRVEDDESRAKYEDFFDAIEEFRPLEPRDRITDRLQYQLDETPEQTHTFDVELWFHSDENIREEWLDELEERVAELGGEWIDQYTGVRAGVLLVRIQGDYNVAHGVADLDQVSVIDAVPTASLEPEELAALQDIESLPAEIPSPPDDAPVLGLIDTGVLSGHPLLTPAIVDAVALDGSFGEQAEDVHGHGTAVAGLMLYGDVYTAVVQGDLQAPVWLASVRVLDDDGRAPAGRNWIASISEAIVYLAEELECRVINLSFGDGDTPFRGGKSTPLAAELDTLARRYRLLLVVSAGNIDSRQLVPAAELLADWPRYLTDTGNEILDPAQSALAITVGAVADRDGLSPTSAGTNLGRAPVSSRRCPAPYTRSGPGVRGAVKPEVVADGGNWVFDKGTGELIADPAVEVLSTSARYPSRLFGTAVGTSFSAPVVTHLAGRLQAAYPELSANALRALIAQGSAISQELADSVACFDDAERVGLNLHGYGQPSWERAGISTPSRVVLYAEDEVRPDGFHVYRVPMTEAFTQTSGPHSVTVALAFDPPVRHRRFDYLAYEMDFVVVRGIGLVDLFDLAAAGIKDPEAGTLSKYELKLRPTRTTRSRGTLQVGSVGSSQRPREKFHSDWYIVVRSLNKWMDVEAPPQPYALTATLEVERTDELYSELEAEVRIELEARLRAAI